MVEQKLDDFNRDWDSDPDTAKSPTFRSVVGKCEYLQTVIIMIFCLQSFVPTLNDGLNNSKAF